MLDAPDATEEAVDRVCRLRTPELLLLAASRLWVADYLNPDDPGPSWRDGFRASGLDPIAADAFGRLFAILEAGATRELAFHRPACHCLGADETGLLQAFALVQRGREREAGQILAAWLAPAAVRNALACASVVAGAMAVARLQIPLRGGSAGQILNNFRLSDQDLASVH